MKTRVLTLVAAYGLMANVASAAEPVHFAGEELRQQTPVPLAFDRNELPAGVYHDLMVPLADERRSMATWIAGYELSKYPAGYLRDIGVRAIGVFESCASRTSDGFRPYDPKLKGYRYFGIYNGKDAIAAAYYTDEQLPLTIHHEIFHHIDLATDPDVKEDRRLTEVLVGKNLYPAPKIAAADLAERKQRSQGNLLIDAVSEYAAKNPAEDKAETARYLMSTLPDSLVQIATQPKLAGSQRILHVLDKYRRSLDGKGPTIDGFVDFALGRRQESSEANQLARQLHLFSVGQVKFSEAAARELLKHAAWLSAKPLGSTEAVALAQASAAATQQLLTKQIKPADGDQQFVVRGSEDAAGVNWQLRSDVTDFGNDATRLAAIAAAAKGATGAERTQLQNLRLFARFYVFIVKRWHVTDKTRQIFDDARGQFVTALVAADPTLETRLEQLDLEGFADGITSEGTLLGLDNPYLKKVDEEIEDHALRAVIRGVQPACVQLGGGSGVNLSPAGRILTAAHVAVRLNNKLTAEFPDGERYDAVCTAIDGDLDLAICKISTKDRLPFARISGTAPSNGDTVVCIGQPGTRTPSGEPTGYQPFHVSTGNIHGFLGDPLGTQRLGRTKHDAWTYWGHSGSPLFNEHGRVVAMHNSWDPQTAMRHAVTQQAIAKFVTDEGLGETIAAKSH